LGQFLAPNADRKYTLEAANKIYLDSKFSIKNTYKEIIDQFYSGTFEALNFGAPFDVAQNVNKFVKEKTHDKIKELITADAISNDTKLILVNAIYYKVSIGFFW
jgi:serpin B